MKLFDLSGPSFLLVFAAMAVVAAGAAMALRWWLTGVDRPPFSGALSAIELAYLAGGRRRAVEAAAVGHLHRGDPRDPRALMAASAGEAEAVAARLEEDGLLLSGRWARALVALAPALAVLSAGAIKLGIGISRHRPVGFLVAALALGGWGVVWYANRFPRLTRRGAAALEARRTARQGLAETARSAPEQVTAEEASEAYALYGAAALGGAALALMPVSTAQAASSSCGTSCGSSCGGGGCGGGCGGCGGCS